MEVHGFHFYGVICFYGRSQFPKRRKLEFEWRGEIFLISLILISCILVALLTGGGLVPELTYPSAQTIILPSILDPATYETITLSNGLNVTLISDYNSTRGAAGIAVGVCSSSDPRYFPGRAEYLQQVLLSGSARFQARDSFAKVLAYGAGAKLTETAEDTTVFAFETDDVSFTMALNQFVDAFVEPNLYPNPAVVLSPPTQQGLAEVLISANSTNRPPANFQGVAIRKEILGLFQRNYVPANTMDSSSTP